MTDIRASFAREGLVRARDERVLAGVCAGLGRRIGLDPWPTRLLFVLLTILLPGTPLVFYVVLWVLMPDERDAAAWQATPHVPDGGGAGA
ncbi:MAG TPA: PspC domain-containing protein [Motilibacteraceae bacterium]|nr:PspC domain-containing protein [Motilibacteraceae bacterium]